MMPPPSSRPTSAVAAGDATEPARFEATNINLVTLLATEYLNHFNEAVMLLEMLPSAPDCKEDFIAWEPMSYVEHFEASRFKTAISRSPPTRSPTGYIAGRWTR